MGLTARESAARVAWGLAFTVALPAALVWWAASLDLGLPPYRLVRIGWLLAAAGFALWLQGVVTLVGRGGGLPMNAFPPPRFVATGVFAWVAHPLYLGAVVIAAGVSLATGSAEGLWLVTPVLALACAALVIGYERPDLDRRFGPGRARAWLSLPAPGDTPLRAGERLAVWFVVLVPWFVIYMSVKLLGQPADAIDVRFAAERTWPVWTWTVPVYVSAYALVPLMVWLVPTRAGLRAFGVRGLFATGALTVIYLVVPLISPPRPFDASGPLGALLAADQAVASPPVAAFPAFHALWAFLAADAVAPRSRAWAAGAWLWAAAVGASCVTTGMHATVDVVAAGLFFLPLRRLEVLWRRLLDWTERLANGWRASLVGPVRVINHGVFAGAAAAAGVAGMASLTGPAMLPAAAAVPAGVLIGAALWAQAVEGSPALQRPFGYYGGLIGGITGAGAAALAGQPLAVALAAAAVVAPWVHAIGRLRCLVQGCCHGRPAPEAHGIRVTNPHSRAVSLAGLAGVPIHATPLYSILGNVLIGLALGRLWCLHAPVGFIAGMYLVLSGLARFMEEAYRGEPQTKIIRGLPIYQHFAIVAVVAGVWLTTWDTAAAPAAAGLPGLPILATAAAMGVVYWLAMGVDFPDSRRRFARLSG